MGKNFRESVSKNIVTILFALLCVATFLVSKVSFSYFLQELVVRIVRNSILVLALIIPVITGLGLNFSIVLGAMAAQTALILVTHWHIGGVGGVLLACVLTIPLAALLGWLMGQLFNRTKGQEMITGMIAGYFANGIYQFVFIVLLGSVIPFHDNELLLSGGVGIKSTIVLESTKALDNLFTIRCDLFITMACVLMIAIILLRLLHSTVSAKKGLSRGLTRKQYVVRAGAAAAVALAAVFCQMNRTVLEATKSFFVPAGTVILVAVLSVFCLFLTKTKLGQNFRAVGRDRKVAISAGINVDKMRIIAIILSTVLAGIGQIVSLQNIGSFATYSAHDSVATYAIAAILVGGATVKEAKVRNVFLGLTLFHSLFIVAPQAGIQLFGDAVYGEYFRSFVSYGVIALALVFNAVQTRNLKLKQLREATML